MCIRDRGDIGPEAGMPVMEGKCVLFKQMCIRDRLKLLIKAQIQLERLYDALTQKAAEFDDVIKMGRTQLQDAVPIRLGQEFRAYREAVRRDIARLERAQDEMRCLNLGGTAIGTGINADEMYLRRVVPTLRCV